MEWLVLALSIFLTIGVLIWAFRLAVDQRHKVYLDDRGVKVRCPSEREKEFLVHTRHSMRAFICPSCGKLVGVPEVKCKWVDGRLF